MIMLEFRSLEDHHTPWGRGEGSKLKIGLGRSREVSWLKNVDDAHTQNKSNFLEIEAVDEQRWRRLLCTSVSKKSNFQRSKEERRIDTRDGAVNLARKSAKWLISKE